MISNLNAHLLFHASHDLLQTQHPTSPRRHIINLDVQLNEDAATSNTKLVLQELIDYHNNPTSKTHGEYLDFLEQQTRRVEEEVDYRDDLFQKRIKLQQEQNVRRQVACNALANPLPHLNQYPISFHGAVAVLAGSIAGDAGIKLQYPPDLLVTILLYVDQHGNYHEVSPIQRGGGCLPKRIYAPYHNPVPDNALIVICGTVEAIQKQHYDEIHHIVLLEAIPIRSAHFNTTTATATLHDHQIVDVAQQQAIHDTVVHHLWLQFSAAQQYCLDNPTIVTAESAKWLTLTPQLQPFQHLSPLRKNQLFNAGLTICLAKIVEIDIPPPPPAAPTIHHDWSEAIHTIRDDELKKSPPAAKSGRIQLLVDAKKSVVTLRSELLQYTPFFPAAGSICLIATTPQLEYVTYLKLIDPRQQQQQQLKLLSDFHKQEAQYCIKQVLAMSHIYNYIKIANGEPTPARDIGARRLVSERRRILQLQSPLNREAVPALLSALIASGSDRIYPDNMVVEVVLYINEGGEERQMATPPQSSFWKTKHYSPPVTPNTPKILNNSILKIIATAGELRRKVYHNVHHVVTVPPPDTTGWEDQVTDALNNHFIAAQATFFRLVRSTARAPMGDMLVNYKMVSKPQRQDVEELNIGMFYSFIGIPLRSSPIPDISSSLITFATPHPQSPSPRHVAQVQIPLQPNCRDLSPATTLPVPFGELCLVVCHDSRTCLSIIPLTTWNAGIALHTTAAGVDVEQLWKQNNMARLLFYQLAKLYLYHTARIALDYSAVVCLQEYVNAAKKEQEKLGNDVGYRQEVERLSSLSEGQFDQTIAQPALQRIEEKNSAYFAALKKSGRKGPPFGWATPITLHSLFDQTYRHSYDPSLLVSVVLFTNSHGEYLEMRTLSSSEGSCPPTYNPPVSEATPQIPPNSTIIACGTVDAFTSCHYHEIKHVILQEDDENHRNAQHFDFAHTHFERAQRCHFSLQPKARLTTYNAHRAYALLPTPGLPRKCLSRNGFEPYSTTFLLLGVISEQHLQTTPPHSHSVTFQMFQLNNAEFWTCKNIQLTTQWAESLPQLGTLCLALVGDLNNLLTTYTLLSRESLIDTSSLLHSTSPQYGVVPNECMSNQTKLLIHHLILYHQQEHDKILAAPPGTTTVFCSDYRTFISKQQQHIKDNHLQLLEHYITHTTREIEDMKRVYGALQPTGNPIVQHIFQNAANSTLIGSGQYGQVFSVTSKPSGRAQPHLAIKVSKNGASAKLLPEVNVLRQVLQSAHLLGSCAYIHAAADGNNPLIVSDLIPEYTTNTSLQQSDKWMDSLKIYAIPLVRNTTAIGGHAPTQLDKFSLLHQDLIPELLNQLLAAQLELETLGIIHRDIKPANIALLSAQGLKQYNTPHHNQIVSLLAENLPFVVQLLDLGIAKIVKPTQPTTSLLDDASAATFPSDETTSTTGQGSHTRPYVPVGESYGYWYDRYCIAMTIIQLIVGYIPGLYTTLKLEPNIAPSLLLPKILEVRKGWQVSNFSSEYDAVVAEVGEYLQTAEEKEQFKRYKNRFKNIPQRSIDLLKQCLSPSPTNPFKEDSIIQNRLKRFGVIRTIKNDYWEHYRRTFVTTNNITPAAIVSPNPTLYPKDLPAIKHYWENTPCPQQYDDGSTTSPRFIRPTSVHAPLCLTTTNTAQVQTFSTTIAKCPISIQLSCPRDQNSESFLQQVAVAHRLQQSRFDFPGCFPYLHYAVGGEFPIIITDHTPQNDMIQPPEHLKSFLLGPQNIPVLFFQLLAANHLLCENHINNVSFDMENIVLLNPNAMAQYKVDTNVPELDSIVVFPFIAQLVNYLPTTTSAPHSHVSNLRSIALTIMKLIFGVAPAGSDWNFSDYEAYHVAQLDQLQENKLHSSPTHYSICRQLIPQEVIDLLDDCLLLPDVDFKHVQHQIQKYCSAFKAFHRAREVFWSVQRKAAWEEQHKASWEDHNKVSPVTDYVLSATADDGSDAWDMSAWGLDDDEPAQ